MTRSTGQGIVNFVNLPNRFQAKGWPINRFTVATTIQSPTLVTPVLSPFANDKQPADRPRVICIEVRSSFVRPPAVLPNHRRKTREIPSRAGARLAPSTTTPVPILLPRPRPFPPPFSPATTIAVSLFPHHATFVGQRVRRLRTIYAVRLGNTRYYRCCCRRKRAETERAHTALCDRPNVRRTNRAERNGAFRAFGHFLSARYFFFL